MSSMIKRTTFSLECISSISFLFFFSSYSDLNFSSVSNRSNGSLLDLVSYCKLSIART